jgi:UDP-N-acetylmuramate-alanine ligase
MKHKVKHVHFVGIGGVAMSSKQGLVAAVATGCDRPRLALAADLLVRTGIE